MSNETVGRSPFRGLAVNLALAVSSLGLAFTVAEVAVRYRMPSASPMRFVQVQAAVGDTLERDYGFAPGGAGDKRVRDLPFDKIFQSHPELFWKLAPGVRLPDDHWPMFGLVSNQQGLREDHEIAVPKPSGEIRILFVGDSCTFGLLLAHTQTVAYLAEEGLRSRLPERHIECINAGVPAYSLYQGSRWLESEGLRYQPDLVVFSFGWNDAGTWDGKSDLQHYRKWKSVQPPGLLGRSRLCQLAWKATHSPAAEPEQRRPRLNPEEYRTILEQVREVTSRRGIDLLLLVGAGRINIADRMATRGRTAYQRHAYEVGATIPFGPDGDVGLLDAVPIVQAMAATMEPSQLYHDEVHPTAAVNQEIANALVRKLTPWLATRARGGPQEPR